MTNGDELKDRVEYESLIKSLPSDERSIRIAMQLYDLTVKVESAGGVSKKLGAVSGGISGGIIAGITLLVEYIRGR